MGDDPKHTPPPNIKTATHLLPQAMVKINPKVLARYPKFDETGKIILPYFRCAKCRYCPKGSADGKGHHGKCKSIHPNLIEPSIASQLEDFQDGNFMSNWLAYAEEEKNDPPQGFEISNAKETTVNIFPDDDIDVLFNDCSKQIKDLLARIKQNKKRPLHMKEILEFHRSSGIDLANMDKDKQFNRLVNLALG